MNIKSKCKAIRFAALLLALVQLFTLAGCGKNEPAPTETSTAPEAEVHNHSFVDGKCECGASNGFEGVTVQTSGSLTAVTREDTDSGMTLSSANAPGEMEGIRLEKDLDAVYGHYYEVVYRFTSNVAGTVRFLSDDAAYYESNEYEVKAGENEITVRFAAGSVKNGKVHTSLELGGLDKFQLSFSSITCKELKEDLSAFFLDIAPEKASGSMTMTGKEELTATYKTDEGWRAKLAVDRRLVKGKAYETTFVFTKSGGRPENVTYTVYDGAASIIGSKTYWVDSDVCVATFYLMANKTITKGTCLELGQLCGGQEVSLTFTYVGFQELKQEKLEALLAENPFPGVGVWTESSLTPATGVQSSAGLTVTNVNPVTDWWKVKLEQSLNGEKGKYYKIVYTFDSNAQGQIKFVNDDADYYGSNLYQVKKGKNVFEVEIKFGGNAYSCLELGGLGPFALTFTGISITEIEKPSKPQYQADAGTAPSNTRFSAFHVWTESAMKPLSRTDTATTMTITSTNPQTDWWKVKLERDIQGEAGKCYQVVFKFTSNAAGRIKFVNDGAKYYGGNEYDVVAGENEFTIKFKYAGNPYSCLELGGLGQFKLTFTDYILTEIEEPETVSNGFEDYRVWTHESLIPATREDTQSAMTVISTNDPSDWWHVKLEKDLETIKDHYYEITFKFTSDVSGKIQFVNDGAEYLNDQVYDVKAGENQFTVSFKASGNPYSCLELGGLGKFRLTFSEILFREIEKPEEPPVHTHAFVNGVCSCGEKNAFAGIHVWTEGSLTPATREDTESTMTITSTNAPGDWWKVKAEGGFATEAGRAYEAVYTFTSNVEGDIKFGTNEHAACIGADVYHVVVGENTFRVQFTVQQDAYTCLELGGLGAFRLVFTGLSLKEIEKPTDPDTPPEHTHSFENGKCSCGQTNGFENVNVWTEGSLTPATRTDTESTMTVISTNAPGDWWKVKVEGSLAITEGKTYELTYAFTSNTTGRIKCSVNGAAFTTSQEYDVQSGENVFTVKFKAGADTYGCLELGGLGNFQLTFSEISLEPVECKHNFEKGVCTLCGAENGFAGIHVWTEGSLTPATRTDTASAMTVSSTNAPGDWWKVKVEGSLAITEGKTYELTYAFTSNTTGRIKCSVNGAAFATSQEYDVQSGENVFTVRFTAGADTYGCLELGGLGNFQLTFTGIALREVPQE